MRTKDELQGFFTVRTEGGLLPGAFLQRLARAATGGGNSIDGLTAGAYHLMGNERLNEAANHAWNRLRGAWEAYRRKLDRLPADDPGTTVTREKWLLPLFQELGYGRLQTSDAGAYAIDGKSYPVSHGWDHTPVHLLGSRVDLDTRTKGVAGAARTSPHSLVQELLNRSPEHLWAFLSNGHRLRILRDNLSLSRQSYVEFDLETMMEGEIYSDFLVLFLLCHQSRVEPQEDDDGDRRPERCWLERWTHLARERGTRALDQMRHGVKDAISELGRGFLGHRANERLRDDLRSGRLDKQDYYRQLLRVVYRLIFLFTAEDRDLLFVPDAPAEAKERYRRHYSTARLRRIAGKTKAGPHPDLWRTFTLVAGKLAEPAGCPELALPALGSHLWDPAETAALDGCDLANRDFLAAVYDLAFTHEGKVRQNVDYKNLGPEELGSVYEALLELHPELHIDTATFTLKSVAGHERKTTGSYYTPTSLINVLLDSALDPVVEEAAGAADPETTLLALKVCDPACGSGHFLIAAAHRIAKALAVHRSGDDEPSPQAVQHALRDVIAHCVYGVDINPMALELCKVNLWLEALDPGKPLAFLDHHLQCGNSLLGSTPRLLEEGIPDQAFQVLEGDDKQIVKKYRAINRRERRDRMSGQSAIDYVGPWNRMGDLARGLTALEKFPSDTLEAVHRQEERFQEIFNSTDYQESRLWADSWCAAFVWYKDGKEGATNPITEGVFRTIEKNPRLVDSATKVEVRRLAEEFGFFHWHLAFPEVFYVPESGRAIAESEAGWHGGFDVILGNPPWEKTQVEEVPFFSSLAPEIAELAGNERKDEIHRLEMSDSTLARKWLRYKRRITGVDALFRRTNLFPLAARGKFNTYALFTELNMRLAKNRVGTIVPTGLATEFTSRFLFQHIVESGRLVSIFDFENKKRLFRDLDSRYRFSLVTLGERRRVADPEFEFACRLLDPVELRGSDARGLLLQSDISKINPNTKTLPIFSNLREADLAVQVHRLVPILKSNGTSGQWNVEMHRMINMSDDSEDFISPSGVSSHQSEHELLRLYEAKMFHQFDHRWASLDKAAIDPVREDPNDFSKPRYLVPKQLVTEKIPERWDRQWLLAWRDVTNATNERTVIATVLPMSGVGHTAFLMYPESPARLASALTACLSSFVVDFIARMKITGTHLPISSMEEIPCLTPNQLQNSTPWSHDGGSLVDWLGTRTLELSYTAWDLVTFAADCGYNGPPFRWDDKRRFELRCELDAAFFHLYGIDHGALTYIMETFPKVKKADFNAYGDFRTKHVILEIYDQMQHSIDTGEPYQTRLDPPPAHPSLAHPADTRPDDLLDD